MPMAGDSCRISGGKLEGRISISSTIGGEGWRAAMSWA